MVFTTFQNLKKVWLVLLVTPIIGCQSMSEPQVSEENLVKISQQELIELRQSHQQFQAMKPELERLLTIESELTLLTEQLTLLNAQQTEPEKTKKSSVTAPQFIAEPTAKFALQLASVTELPRLTARLAEIKKQAPALFNGQFIANVESVTVNGSTFHRLKIGIPKCFSVKNTLFNGSALKRNTRHLFTIFHIKNLQRELHPTLS